MLIVYTTPYKSNMAWFEEWFNSPYYHVLYQHRDEKEAEVFINNLLDNLEIPQDAHLLDLPCGKGRHALFLSQHGYEVTGADLAPESIALANKMSHEKLHFIVHDMREVIQHKHYDAIFNLFTSFGYFDTFDENAKVLHAAYQMLKNNGIMVIDFMNAAKVAKQLISAETKTLNGISFDIKREIANNRINKNIRFIAAGNVYEYQETVAIIKQEDFLAYFEATGFEVIRQYGNYQLTPYQVNESDRLIFILKKK